MKIGQGTLLTMMYNGVTHNFIREEDARKIRMKFTPTEAHLKAVNSPLDAVICTIL